MTSDGIERLIGYQRSYFGKDWRYSMTAGDFAEVKLSYMDAFKEYDDDNVLAGYIKHVREWERLPTIAQIMMAADGEASASSSRSSHKGMVCRVCGLPWGASDNYGRDEGRMPGEAQKVILRDRRDEKIGRCPECNARLPKPVPAWVFIDGWTLGDEVHF